MTNEEMQRAMEFIIDMQAKSSAKIDDLVETQKRAEEKWSRTEEGIRALLAIAELHEREIQSHSEQIMKNSEQILSLGEQTRSTDERLNALINVVERQISKGRNGKQ